MLYVLAGVNGAGKSSVGGHLLTEAGLSWFNPDTFARQLMGATHCDQTTANATAWTEGQRRLDEALAKRHSFAFETTLGGHSVAKRLKLASRTHEVLVWFCGLTSPELHIARVGARVAAGGHAISAAKIRERWITSIANLIGLLPHLAQARLFDNSASVAPGEPLPDPRLVAVVDHGQLAWPSPDEATILALTPDWAKPVLEAALNGSERALD